MPPSPQPTISRPVVQRLAGLDGLRGIAAAGVAVHHLFFHYGAVAVPAGLAERSVSWLHHSGWTLVDLFFVLSGFVFAHVYLSDDALRTFAGQRQFWIARLARLWPLHIATLLLFALMLPSPGDSPFTFAAHLVMMQGFAVPVAHTYNPASWSLTMEMMCYVLFAVAALAGRRAVNSLSLVMVTIAGIYFIEIADPGGPWVDDAPWRGLLGFFIGQNMWRARGLLTRIPSWFLGLAVIAGFWLQTGPYSPVLPLNLLAWPALLLLGLKLPLFGSRPMVWLGDRSYAIYLLNLPVILGLREFLPADRLAGELRPLVLGAMTLAVLALGELSYRWLELPARNKVRSLLQRSGKPRPKALPA